MSKQYILLFMQTLPQMNRTLPIVEKLLETIQKLPQTIQKLPQAIQKLPQTIQRLLLSNTMPLVNNKLPLVTKALSLVSNNLPQVAPFEVKFGILLAFIIVSYISHYSYLQNKVILLEKTVKRLESEREEMKQTISDTELILGDCDKRVEFIFTNISYLQKALYKKLECEEKYKQRKKDPNLVKNRQQANQEYLTAEMTVARRFTEG